MRVAHEQVRIALQRVLARDLLEETFDAAILKDGDLESKSQSIETSNEEAYKSETSKSHHPNKNCSSFVFV